MVVAQKMQYAVHEKVNDLPFKCVSELLCLFLCLLLADDHIAQTDLTDLRDLFCKVRELREDSTSVTRSMPRYA